MLKLGNSSNGVQVQNFIHNFRHLLLYSTSTSISTSISSDQLNPKFTDYLISTLGFSKQQAVSTSSKFLRYRLGRGATKISDFNFIVNADSVVQYLKQIGLRHSQIQSAVVSNPQILLCNVEKNLIPKTLVIREMGISGPDYAEIVKVNPKIFAMGLDSNIIPAIQALKEIMGSDQSMIEILKRTPRMRLSCVPKLLVPNVAFLRSHGVSIESIRKCLIRSPFTFLRKTEFFEGAVVRAEEELRIPRDSPQFLPGIVLLTSHKDVNIELKRRMFKSFGWTDSDVLTLSSSSPFLFALSEATIQKKLGYLMNEIGYEPSFLAKRCCLLTCSLEKRIVPRHKLLLILKENGLIKMDQSLVSVITLTEDKFLKRFVLPFKEIHQVYSKLAGVSLKMLAVGSSKPISNAA